MVFVDVEDGWVDSPHVAGGDKETEEAVEPDRSVLCVPFGSFDFNLWLICFKSRHTSGSLKPCPHFVAQVVCCRGDVADDEVAEPHGDEEGSRPGVQVDQDQGERRDSEADL